MNSFEKIFRGLEILKLYTPNCLTVEPVANSFPNGAPDHSRSAYISVDVGIDGWNISEDDKEKLIKWGWISEQEDQYWIHYGG